MSLRIVDFIHFSFIGINMPATGPTTKAQIIVPRPTVPPRINPVRAKEKSTITRIMLNLKCSLSLITIATRSFGPVPASDLMTIVMPKARMAHPRILTIILAIRDTSPAKSGLKIRLKKSIIGPPQIMQMMVPILTYVRSTINKIRIINKQIEICTLPCVNSELKETGREELCL